MGFLDIIFCEYSYELSETDDEEHVADEVRVDLELDVFTFVDLDNMVEMFFY